MFARHTEEGYLPAVPGIVRKTLVYGEKTLLAEFRLAAGSRLPEHQHPNEQSGYLVAGRMRLTIGGTPHEVTPGDSWCIPAGMPHSAEILEDSLAVEVFAPLREDYLPEQ